MRAAIVYCWIYPCRERTPRGRGDYVEQIWPADAKPRQSILGVVAAASGRTWFVKLIGDHFLVLREKPRFEQFAKSLKLR